MQEYWKSKLTQQQKGLYDQLLRGIANFERDVAIGVADQSDIENVFRAVNNDHPELYWIPYAMQISTSYGFMSRKTVLQLDYIYNRVQINSIDRSLEQTKRQLLNTGNAGSDLEKEKHIYEAILSSTKYEVNNVNNQNAAAALYYHKAQCSGIAKAVKLMCDWVDLPSIIIDGVGTDLRTGKSDAHSWNMVQIAGSWHHLDVTYALGSYNAGGRKYTYFNLSDNEIGLDHKWDRNSTPKSAQAQSANSGITQPRASNSVDVQKDRKVEKVLYTIDQLKNELKAKICKGARSLCFESHIPVKDQSMMEMIIQACGAVDVRVSYPIHFSIQLNGNIATIEW